ncbi:SDR family NAD-dependent epimerase/dehydratase, partial [Candidatus Falkowbacteria bacterium]
MQEKNKTILVTGGAGFVGSHLCEKYLREGHRVICLDNLQKTAGSTENIKAIKKNKNFKFIKHDIIDPIEIKDKLDWVMNFACPVSCIDLQVDPIHTTKSNVHGVINMLEIARKNKAVFIQASSADVYG